MIVNFSLLAALPFLPWLIEAFRAGNRQGTSYHGINLLGSSFGLPGQNVTFDYVIIGGGTAGLTMATRLAENPANSVAVIEAGGFYEIDNGNLSVVPSGATHFTGTSPTNFNPLVDWGFVTTPQEGLNHRRLHYARGKCLGGSSALNYFTYQRGTNGSYGKWASEVGDDAYTFDSLLPYFRKSVNFTPPRNDIRDQNASVRYNPKAFGPSNGPLQVSYPIYSNAFSSFVKKALKQLGLADALDFVSGSLSGVQYNMNTISAKDQSRSSSESSFLRTALNNTTLKVYKSTLAKRILFEGNRASAVLVNTGGKEYVLSAAIEVIVSAGAFQTPQMLMVSGVGPAEILRQHNIPTVSTLDGVGQNMWDHIIFSQSYRVNTITHSALGNPSVLEEATEQFLDNGSGLLGNPGGDLIGWEKYSQTHPSNLSRATRTALLDFPSDWPEIEYLILDAYSGNNENYITGAPQTPFMYASPAVALVAPLSRGNVSISSADTTDRPLISPNWLTHPADRELAVAAFMRIRQIMDTAIMRNVTIGSEVFPGRNVSSADQILQAIQNSMTTTFHGSATCKMGRANDSMAVVDNHAKVYGTQALRVVDISAFPLLPPGHPQATIYAFAEKIAADMMAGF